MGRPPVKLSDRPIPQKTLEVLVTGATSHGITWQDPRGREVRQQVMALQRRGLLAFIPMNGTRIAFANDAGAALIAKLKNGTKG